MKIIHQKIANWIEFIGFTFFLSFFTVICTNYLIHNKTSNTYILILTILSIFAEVNLIMEILKLSKSIFRGE